MKIAIIGAGVSGLVTAYYLKQLIPGVDVTIYEKALKIGGNANTFYVNVGGRPRWVDMGVNDFNKATYTHLCDLWKALGIMDNDGNSPYCRPLQNHESFYVPDGSYRYTVEIDGTFNIPAGVNLDKVTMFNENERFKKLLAAWYHDHEKPDSDVTVGEWLASNNFDEKFVKYNLYPRMNGMYFTMENAPAGMAPPSQMPIWMVAHYYVLQEGYGNKTAGANDTWSRQYFVDGSSHWLEFLAGKLEGMGVKIKFGYDQLHVDRYKGRMTVYNGCVKVDDFDKVVFATHADDTYKMIGFRHRANDAMVEALTKFSYDSCNVYVHQDYSMLAPQGDCNRTYNIHVYDYNSPTQNPEIRRPYTITYIVNYHQNDPQPSTKPLFFVTVNPYHKLDPNKILSQTNGMPAISSFKHCKLDLPAMHAQVAIDDMQLNAIIARDYYFAGSFTRGAGLHEECVIQAMNIAKKIQNPHFIPEDTYSFTGERHFAPLYIRRALGIVAKPVAADAMEAGE